MFFPSSIAFASKIAMLLSSSSSDQEVPPDLYERYVQKYKNRGNTEEDAQMEALNKIKSNFKIIFKEVEWWL